MYGPYALRSEDANEMLRQEQMTGFSTTLRTSRSVLERTNTRYRKLMAPQCLKIPAVRRGVSWSSETLPALASNNQRTSTVYNQLLALKQREMLGYSRP